MKTTECLQRFDLSILCPYLSDPLSCYIMNHPSNRKSVMSANSKNMFKAEYSKYWTLNRQYSPRFALILIYTMHCVYTKLRILIHCYFDYEHAPQLQIYSDSVEAANYLLCLVNTIRPAAVRSFVCTQG